MKVITNNILSRLYHFLSGCDNFIFLDTSKPDTLNAQSLLFTNPVERLRFYLGEDESSFLQEIEAHQKNGYYIAGWFSYEFGYLLEPSLKTRLCRKEDKGSLLADLGVFSACQSFDHLSGETDFPLSDDEPAQLGDYRIDNLRTSQSEKEYVEALSRVLEYIEAGDTYQVNYTLKLFFDFFGSHERFYEDLRRNQSVGYGAYIRWQGQRIMSFSPELFFRKNNSSVMVRPMKGTLKRGRFLEEDEVNKRFLQTDRKNQSENVMIVDLLRNDLGRLMHHLHEGDVRVDSLFDVETYETLLQMTSTITGRSGQNDLDEISLLDFFKAIYPCGSVTGAPKIRTMEIIDELEKGRRGVYTGAIGYIKPDGEAVFNVPIRTVVLNGGTGEMGIGSGIVHDSLPQQEWQECLLKGRFLSAPQESFQLIETLLWLPGEGYLLFEKHLERLQASAQYFLFVCDLGTIRSALLNDAEGFSTSAMRVRLLLDKDGGFSTEWAECDAPAQLHLQAEPAKVADSLPVVVLNQKRVDSSSTWYFHKTTNRELYNREYRDAVKHGFFDTIFVNEKECVTEGCISNIIIYRDGEYLTPPATDGLLAGVMRSSLFDDPKGLLQEKSLTVTDLVSAEAIYLCNSVRGLIRVRLQLDKET